MKELKKNLIFFTLVVHSGHNDEFVPENNNEILLNGEKHGDEDAEVIQFN